MLASPVSTPGPADQDPAVGGPLAHLRPGRLARGVVVEAVEGEALGVGAVPAHGEHRDAGVDRAVDHVGEQPGIGGLHGQAVDVGCGDERLDGGRLGLGVGGVGPDHPGVDLHAVLLGHLAGGGGPPVLERRGAGRAGRSERHHEVQRVASVELGRDPLGQHEVAPRQFRNMGRAVGLLFHNGLLDGGRLDGGLLDGGRLLFRLLFVGGRPVNSFVLGRRAAGIRRRVGFLLRRDWGHGGDWVIVAVIARAGGSQQSQCARGSEHPHIYHSHMI